MDVGEKDEGDDDRFGMAGGRSGTKRRDSRLADLCFRSMTLFTSGSTCCLSSASRAEKLMIWVFGF